TASATRSPTGRSAPSPTASSSAATSSGSSTTAATRSRRCSSRRSALAIVGREAVADPVVGVDQCAAGNRFGQLRAQAADVDVDRAVGPAQLAAPDRVVEVLTGEDPLWGD